MAQIEDFLLNCLAQDGDRYVFGAEVRLDDADPDTFDCSELIQWAAARSKILPTVPDGSWYQARHCQNHRTMIPVPEGVATRGALLFRFVGDPFSGGRPRSAHVAVSLGDGTTIEARGTKWGVGSWSAKDRGWTHAARIPGVDYTARKRLGVHVVDVADPHGVPTEPGRRPFWSVFSSGHVIPMNGARPFLDLGEVALNAPITGAWFDSWVRHGGELVLSAAGDGGTFALH